MRLYPYYVVGCLMLASALSFLDRLVLALLIDPIRADLGLTDSEVSLLVGAAFATCYVGFAFIFGRWVDLHGRRNAVVVGIVLWSLATALCGLANSFGKMFAARAAVGVGEASLNPAAYSIIADYFPPERRGVGMAIFACGASIGGGLAILLGGMVVQWAMATKPCLPLMCGAAPWQVVFVVVGLPGLLVAALFALTVREPPRRYSATESELPPTFADIWQHLRGNARVFLPMFGGYAFLAVSGYAFSVWGPAYFMRLHGLSPAAVGLLFGIGYGGFGTLGVLLGGVICDRLQRIDAPVLVTIGAILLQAPFLIAAYIVGSTGLATILFVGGMFAASMVAGMQAAMVQSLSPSRMRGMMAALYGAVVTIAGLGIAPTVTALLSDHVFGGPMGIGKGLAATTAGALALAMILILAGRSGAAALATRLQGSGASESEESQPINSPPSTGRTMPVT